jgi:predicted phosphate transport protein (TIGR00153 family)
MFRVSSKDTAFFKLFSETADIIDEAADLLADLMTRYSDVDAKIRTIKDVEHRCDQHVHLIIAQLHKSFITPIDREDIYALAKEMDEVTDAIDETAQLFTIYNIEDVHEDSLKMVRLVTQCTAELKLLIADLNNLKRTAKLRERIIEINRIENEGDVLFREIMTGLFASSRLPLEVFKWKEIYEHLENTLDACEHVANIIDGIVMKHG